MNMKHVRKLLAALLVGAMLLTSVAAFASDDNPVGFGFAIPKPDDAPDVETEIIRNEPTDAPAADPTDEPAEDEPAEDEPTDEPAEDEPTEEPAEDEPTVDPTEEPAEDEPTEAPEGEGDYDISLMMHVPPELCDHPAWAKFERTETKWYEPEYEMDPDDEMNHKVTYPTVTYTECTRCGWRSEEVPGESVVQYEVHRLIDDGNGTLTCEDCEYVSTCKHEWDPAEVYYDYDDPAGESYKPVDDKTHIAIYKVMRASKTCKICGAVEEVIYSDDEMPTQEVVEYHAWDEENGGKECAWCGYKNPCTHPAEYLKTKESKILNEDGPSKYIDDKTHSATYFVTKTTVCQKCGAAIDGSTQEVTITEPHYIDVHMRGGECEVCEYKFTCPHANTETYTDHRLLDWWGEAVDYLSTTAEGHIAWYMDIPMTRCKDCGAEFYTEGYDKEDGYEAYDWYPEFEPHTFVNGQCTICGYIAPKTTTAKKDEGPVYVEVPAGTVVHGLTVGEPLPLGVTMATAVQGIIADYGADTEVSVKNIDKVLTAQEMTSLDALAPVDQMLVVLSALGYDEEVNGAVKAMNLTLSPEAQALIEAIKARIAAMTPEELAAFEEILAKYFPTDGGLKLVLQIAKAVGDTRLERYSFTQNESGEWMFVKLEVAE